MRKRRESVYRAEQHSVSVLISPLWEALLSFHIVVYLENPLEVTRYLAAEHPSPTARTLIKQTAVWMNPRISKHSHNSPAAR